MKSIPKLWKRTAAGAIGLTYAVMYGFWTMLATGGGHANFVWLGLFILVYLMGIYFPLMAVLAVDLRSRFAKIIFGGLLAYGLLGSALLLGSWVSGATGESLDDFGKLWSRGPALVIFCGAIHFLPIFFFSFLLIKAMVVGETESDDSPVSLGLS